MDIKCLRTFQAVVQCGTYARAAEHLGYTQSTVTVHIKQLERDLGIPLFERVGRRMVLTQKGAEALTQAADIIAAADRLGSLATAEGELSGELRVDVAESLLCYAMNEVISEFRERAPGVRLRLRDGSLAQISRTLPHAECDLSLLYAVDWQPDDMVVETIAHVSTVAVVATTVAPPDLQASGHSVTMPFIIDEPDSVFRIGFERSLAERGIDLADTMELWTTHAIRRLVTLGMGFTIAPRFAVADDLAAGQLQTVPSPSDDLAFPVLLAYRKTTWLTPAAQLFIEVVKEHLPAALSR